MKTKQNLAKKCMAAIGVAGLLGLFTLSSCLKNHSNDVVPVQPHALVSFIQASPDAPSLDFYLDNNRVNGNYSLIYGDEINYFNAITGKRTANFYAAGTSNKIASDTTTFKDNTFYTLILANKISTPNVIVLKDTISRPATGKDTIRFVDLSPDAANADLAIQGGSVLVSNKAYKGFSSFIPVTGGITYTFEIRQTGTNTVLASLVNVPIYNGYLYTIWLGGFKAGTGSTALSANIVTNAIYY